MRFRVNVDTEEGREGGMLREINAAINVIARARNGMGLMKKFPFVNVSRILDRHAFAREFCGRCCASRNSKLDPVPLRKNCFVV